MGGGGCLNNRSSGLSVKNRRSEHSDPLVKLTEEKYYLEWLNPRAAIKTGQKQKDSEAKSNQSNTPKKQFSQGLLQTQKIRKLQC